MNWEIVIGIETHVQLATVSKIFSSAPTAFGAAPNTQANALDLALPGTLPVMNKAAVECAIKFGLSVNDGHTDNIAPHSLFARKNYFYPDLPKGYQISQFEHPVVTGGAITIAVDGIEKSIPLTRAHLEEDAGKSFHEGLRTPGVSGIDLNRAGTPLLEVVTEPAMASAAEAVAYARTLHALVMWIGICDGNMQEGSFRCDANVSVRRPGAALGTRCEIKNLNSFRFMERAIQYEARRQIELIEDGGTVVQQTRLYDAVRDETRPMRSKEDAMDYRYFPDPDLLPLTISRHWVESLEAQMPILPQAMRTRFERDHGLSAYDAMLLVQSRASADYFLATIQEGAEPKLACNWINGEIAAKLNEEMIDIAHSKLPPAALAWLVKRTVDGSLSSKLAKEVFRHLWAGDVADFTYATLDAYLAAHGFLQISDAAAIEKLVDEVLAANAKSVAEFKAGKEKALQALVGQVMKASQGKANPTQVNALLRGRLGG